MFYLALSNDFWIHKKRVDICERNLRKVYLKYDIIHDIMNQFKFFLRHFKDLIDIYKMVKKGDSILIIFINSG